MSDRSIIATSVGHPTSDGAGVRLTRLIGAGGVSMIDPFLMLDEFGSDDPEAYIGGFPDHPHRGFETVTYLLAGEVEHKDSAGNRGTLVPGSVQWMTAGRGVIHSEMPRIREGRLWGFQLWVNLPAALKMTPPRYQEIPPHAIPEVAVAGGLVRVVAGRFGDVVGAVREVAVDPLYLDLRLEPGAGLTVPVAADHDGFIYPYRGSVTVEGGPLERGTLGVLGPGDMVALVAGRGGAGALLVAGRPLGEPVARYGPFVMNTRAEIERA
ncbi:MAG: pirin family protein, partial [Nitrospinae bacterium]|nr:pirin family protein [Nitrospinota bacterium]